eukprot:CAMPEP_0206179036 /NCGR_PEP_ID=MMETSP1474-20131121/66308_1 /ASSEMBLY_ACC=CAM_ASM_001110 /TAXON_ID=97495 /ORGANISM="Imantonia sp., Strain RCC918" /LENGTH=100 /DNA_ID=CAMNT_0053592047 /DNA_START=9 /DNA_END=311 /DNA_ORIENTATION=+
MMPAAVAGPSLTFDLEASMGNFNQLARLRLSQDLAGIDTIQRSDYCGCGGTGCPMCQGPSAQREEMGGLRLSQESAGIHAIQRGDYCGCGGTGCPVCQGL